MPCSTDAESMARDVYSPYGVDDRSQCKMTGQAGASLQRHADECCKSTPHQAGSKGFGRHPITPHASDARRQFVVDSFSFLRPLKADGPMSRQLTCTIPASQDPDSSDISLLSVRTRCCGCVVACSPSCSFSACSTRCAKYIPPFTQAIRISRTLSLARRGRRDQLHQIQSWLLENVKF